MPTAAWPVAGVIRRVQSILTYVFRQKLPPGTYSVRTASTGGLVDLSGHTPTARGSSSVFGTFTVSGQPWREPNNLGVFYPDDILNGVDNPSLSLPGRP